MPPSVRCLLWAAASTFLLWIAPDCCTCVAEEMVPEGGEENVERRAKWTYPKMHPEDYSDTMKDCVCKIVKASSTDPEGPEKCRNTTEESFGMLFHELHLDTATKQAFMDTAEWLETGEYKNGGPPTGDGRRRRRLQSDELAALCPANKTMFYTGFGPAYPSGSSYEASVASIRNTFITDGDLTKRTDANAVSAFLITFWAAETAETILEYTCELASEPNTEFICKGAEGIAEVLLSSLESVRDQIDFQDALIDGAEIQAFFENSQTLLDRLCTLDQGVQSLTGGVIEQIGNAHEGTRAVVSSEAALVRANISEKAEETRAFVAEEHQKTREFVQDRFMDLEAILFEEFSLTSFRLDQSDEQMRISRRLLITPEKERPGYADPRHNCGAKKEDIEEFADRVFDASLEEHEFKEALGVAGGRRKLSGEERDSLTKEEFWNKRRVPSDTELLRCPPPPVLEEKGNCTADPILCGEDQTVIAPPFSIPVPQTNTPNEKKIERGERQRAREAEQGSQGGGMFGSKFDFEGFDFSNLMGQLPGGGSQSKERSKGIMEGAGVSAGSFKPLGEMGGDFFGDFKNILDDSVMGSLSSVDWLLRGKGNGEKDE